MAFRAAAGERTFPYGFSGRGGGEDIALWPFGPMRGKVSGVGAPHQIFIFTKTLHITVVSLYKLKKYGSEKLLLVLFRWNNNKQ